MAKWIAGLILAVWGCSCAAAQPAAPLINPTGQQPDGGATALPADASVDQVLDALHVRGQGLKDFTADVSLAEVNALTGDTTTLTGKAWFQELGQGNGRMRILFDKKVKGERAVANFKLEYILDKGWLIERDFAKKLQVERQVLKEGQKMNLLKLGEGPFPLPVGQERSDVQKMFEAKKLQAGKDDPAGMPGIELTPKPNTQFARKFKSIKVWVDPKTQFPRRIETVDRNETTPTQRVTDLTNVKVNTGLDDKTFSVDKTPGDWTVRTEPLEQ